MSMRSEHALRVALAALAVLAAAAGPGCLSIDTPVVTEVSPLEGQQGTEVTIRGNHFIDEFSRTIVLFNGARVSVSDFLSATENELHVRVPAAATTGDLVVKVGSEESARVPFTVIGPYAVVLNEGSSDATVIDTHTQTVKATVPVGSGPFLAAFTPDNLLGYVVSGGDASGSVTVLNAPDLAILATIALDPDPSALVFSTDSEKAYVANRGGGTVSVIDTATSTVAATIGVGQAPAALALDPAAENLYVSNETDGSLSVIDVETETVSTSLVLDAAAGPGEILFRSDGDFAYVLSSPQNSLYVVDTSGPSVSAQVFLDPGVEPVDMVRADTRVYVAHSSGQVSVLRTDDNALDTTVELGGRPAAIVELFTLEGRFVYVLDAATSEIVEISTADRTISNRFSAGSNPVGLGGVVTAEGPFLYIVNGADPGTVTIYEAREFTTPIVVPVGRSPVAVGFQ